ncbi:MAG TPA: L-histidine N(alpha)-methyltransferase [Blastocatellia bacterium]|nr:L-histidine N(alpha)-methyltransferase [Blastocatellia bacterium]
MLGKISRTSTHFDLRQVGAPLRAGQFAQDVRNGLTAKSKFLQPIYFYDDLGSRLFEAICSLPEYYLTRAESEILEAKADDIISLAAGSGGAQCRLIELGSGSAEKTRFLIDVLLDRQEELLYIPIDISAASLEQSANELSAEYPGIKVAPYSGDYFSVLAELRETGLPGGDDSRSIFLFLGSNIGNLNPDESRSFLRDIWKLLSPGDALLLGADLKKDTETLVAAYDDPLGVTAAFNRNLLLRINRELGADFDIGAFEHLALYNDELSRMEMHLVSREPQTVHISSINLSVKFDWRESIHTESSYKFDVETISELASDSGLLLRESWFDRARRFSFNLLVPGH